MRLDLGTSSQDLVTVFIANKDDERSKTSCYTVNKTRFLAFRKKNAHAVFFLDFSNPFAPRSRKFDLRDGNTESTERTLQTLPIIPFLELDSQMNAS